MKEKRIRKTCGIVIAISLFLCIVGALVLSFYPMAAPKTVSVVIVIAITTFSLGCSKWLDCTFKAATGITLSEYYQKLYSQRQ